MTTTHEIQPDGRLLIEDDQGYRSLIDPGDTGTLAAIGAQRLSADEISAVRSAWANYPPIPKPIELRAPSSPVQACGEINAFRDARLATGFADTVTGKTWPCDPQSMGKWDALGSSAGLAMLMLGAQAPRFDLIAGDNAVITLSAVDTFALLNGRVMPWVSATFLFARAMKDAVLAGNPPPDTTKGWP